LTWANDSKTIAQCGVIAALLEVAGYPKPGNVHRTHDFSDIRFEHFIISGVALFPVLEEVSIRGNLAQKEQIPLAELNLGSSILKAIKDNQIWQKTGNINLGIVLLLIPLACAAGLLIRHPTPSTDLLREKIDLIAKHSTSADTARLYEAIRLANPGGLGKVDEFDLNDTSKEVLEQENVNLYDIFRISAQRDSIAREWITKFSVTFDIGYPFFLETYNKTGDINISTVHTYLKILSEVPDTLVARKYGAELASSVSQKARKILSAGGLLSEQSIELLNHFDLELRNNRKINPGTTADLTAATIMVALLAGLRF
jgi:triphosphoribosyl-dephospho-CoA synthase